MGDIIIIVFLVLVVGAAIIPTVKHFKGQGGCCGGSNYKPKKKKLKRVVEKKIFQIDGMHCENCSNRVTSALNDIPYISAEVKLKKGIVIVSYEKKVDDAVIQEKIEKAGYVMVPQST